MTGGVSPNTVYAPKGAAALGIDWRDVDAKYRALVPMAGVGEREIEASLALIHDFRRLSGCGGASAVVAHGRRRLGGATLLSLRGAKRRRNLGRRANATEIAASLRSSQ